MHDRKRQIPKPAGPRTTPRVVKGSGSEYVYGILREQIISLTLPPGADLDEATLVAQLGLSRTPVREALVRLAGTGLVQILPNRGARVAPMGWNDIREHLEAFDVMQRLVTRWAALRRSDADMRAIEHERLLFEQLAVTGDAKAMIACNWRYHAAIAAGSRNVSVERYYLQLLTEDLRICHLAMTPDCFPSRQAYDAHIDDIIRGHREMTIAVRDGDADLADSLACAHVGLARKRVSETLTGSMQPAMQLPLGEPRGEAA